MDNLIIEIFNINDISKGDIILYYNTLYKINKITFRFHQKLYYRASFNVTNLLDNKENILQYNIVNIYNTNITHMENFFKPPIEKIILYKYTGIFMDYKDNILSFLDKDNIEISKYIDKDIIDKYINIDTDIDIDIDIEYYKYNDNIMII